MRLRSIVPGHHRSAALGAISGASRGGEPGRQRCVGWDTALGTAESVSLPAAPIPSPQQHPAPGAASLRKPCAAWPGAGAAAPAAPTTGCPRWRGAGALSDVPWPGFGDGEGNLAPADGPGCLKPSTCRHWPLRSG